MFPKLQRSSVNPSATAWAMVLVGAIAVAACGVGIHFWIARHPDGSIVLTFLIMALGLGLVTALEGLFHQVGIIRPGQLAGWPYAAACIASIAYGLTYGPYVFINTWWQDDWGYLLWDRSFSPQILTTVLNDHLSPLLNLIIWTTTRLFGLDYIGAALLQHGVFILLLLAVAHLLRRASRSAGLLVLFLAAYASWPSHDDARTFFAGGFWLSASAAFLMTYLLHAHTRITDDKGLTPSALVTSAALAAMTVFISSQTMLPVAFLLVLSAAPIAISRARAATIRRTAILAALALIPTACIVVGRAVYVHRAGYDLSGLITGELARNLIIFFSVKVTLIPLEVLAETTRLLPAALFTFLFLIPVALALKVLWDEYAAGKATDEWAARASLIALGCAMWVELSTQIGVARSWGAGSVLNSYYATLPLLAIWIAEFGAVATLLARLVRPLADRHRRYVSGGLVGLAIVVEVGLASAAIHARVPLSRRLEAMQDTNRFLTAVGTAGCSLAQSHPGKTVAWRTRFNLSTDCPSCGSIIGPPEFLRDGRDFLAALAPLAAHDVCDAADAGRIMAGSSADIQTDGADNAAVQEFDRTYVKAR